MAREKFENRKLIGPIKVACKYEDGTVRYWETHKETVVSHIITIVQEYQREGYILTLRQLHYQLVTKNWIVNHDSAYKKLGDILDDCRYAGVIDWSAIEDRGRVPYIPYYNADAQDAVDDTIAQFRIDRQEGQTNTVELWTEKDALSGILKRTTEKYHIHLVVNKGYTSSSAIYNAYSRVLHTIKAGRRFTILYFGDHDPSGLDMVRDIRDRLLFMLSSGTQLRTNEFMDEIQDYWEENTMRGVYELIDDGYAPGKLIKILREDAEDSEELYELYEAARIKWYIDKKQLFQVIPIGLNMEQIEEFNLPPNPTKLTDSRAAAYIEEHGRTCWEVDALRPQTLTQIVEDNIAQQIDDKIFNAALKRELAELEKLKTVRF